MHAIEASELLKNVISQNERQPNKGQGCNALASKIRGRNPISRSDCVVGRSVMTFRTRWLLIKKPFALATRGNRCVILRFVNVCASGKVSPCQEPREDVHRGRSTIKVETRFALPFKSLLAVACWTTPTYPPPYRGGLMNLAGFSHLFSPTGVILISLPFVIRW